MIYSLQFQANTHLAIMYCTKYSEPYITEEPKNRFQGTNSGRLCSLAGRYDNLIPTRFLAPIDCLKIPAQYSRGTKSPKCKIVVLESKQNLELYDIAADESLGRAMCVVVQYYCVFCHCSLWVQLTLCMPQSNCRSIQSATLRMERTNTTYF
jgi:hypothetical protein